MRGDDWRKVVSLVAFVAFLFCIGNIADAAAIYGKPAKSVKATATPTTKTTNASKVSVLQPVVTADIDDLDATFGSLADSSVVGSYRVENASILVINVDTGKVSQYVTEGFADVEYLLRFHCTDDARIIVEFQSVEARTGLERGIRNILNAVRKSGKNGSYLRLESMSIDDLTDREVTACATFLKKETKKFFVFQLIKDYYMQPYGNGAPTTTVINTSDGKSALQRGIETVNNLTSAALSVQSLYDRWFKKNRY